MADEPTQPTPDGTPANPITVQIAGTPPGGPVFAAEGLDVAPQPGGAYRFIGLDGSEYWKDAEGNEIKKPKGK